MTPAQPHLRKKHTHTLLAPHEQRVYPPDEIAIQPKTVWATLSPFLQAQLRQTLLRITQELLHEPGCP